MKKSTNPSHKYRLLIVDDETEILKSLKRLLRSQYKVYTANTVQEGIEIFKTEMPDLVMSDNKMPQTTGVEFLHTLYNINPNPVRILFTGYTSTNAAISAINKGHVYGFITKPWDPDELKLLIKSALEKYELENTNRNLLKQLKDSYKKVLDILTIALESRDAYTSGHSYRVAYYSMIIGKELKLPSNELKILYNAALLHDVGKIGITESILNKQGSLEHVEKEHIQEHPIIGAKILSPLPEFEEISNLVIAHHEYLDGTGYPQKLKGDEIPFLAKIITVADVFDALTTDRSYRKAFPVEKAMEEMKKESGIHFEPDVLDVFENILKERKIDVELIKRQTRVYVSEYYEIP